MTGSNIFLYVQYISIFNWGIIECFLTVRTPLTYFSIDEAIPHICCSPASTVVLLYSSMWLIGKPFLSVSLSLCTGPAVECKDHVLACTVGYPSQITAFAYPLTLPLLPSSPLTFRLSPCASNRVEMGTSHPSYMHTHSLIPVVQWPMQDRGLEWDWWVLFIQIIHFVLQYV